MRYIFNLNEEVEVISDGSGGYFVGVIGIIEDVTVGHDGNTIYGIRLTKGTDIVDIKTVNNLLYFLASELQ